MSDPLRWMLNAMSPSQQLAEATRHIAHRLAQRDIGIAKELATVLSDFRELRWLEKDYEDEKQGDWTR